LYDVTILDASGSSVDTLSSIGNDWSAVGTDLAENPVSNHSFETAGSGGNTFANWTDTDSGTVISRDTTDQDHGAASAKFTNSQNSADLLVSDLFEVSELQDLRLSFSVKASNATAQPRIDIKWYDSAQAALSDTTVYQSNTGTTPTSWTRVVGLNVSPVASARYAAIEITGNEHATQYNTWFDNVVIQRINTFEDVPYQPAGLTLSSDTDTAHDVNVTAGAVKDATFAYDMILATEMTKQIDAAWAEGDDAGGLDTGAVAADTGYALWLIKNITTGIVDLLFSTSFTSPTMPSGYTVKRLIGYVLTDASANIEAFFHKGRIFRFVDPPLLLNDATVTDGIWSTATLQVPPECLLAGGGHMHTGGSTGTEEGMYIISGDQANTTADGLGWFEANMSSGVDFEEVTVQGWTYVDTSQQVDYTVTGGAASPYDINLYAYYIDMLTRDMP
jgi:hypothetical protein